VSLNTPGSSGRARIKGGAGGTTLDVAASSVGGHLQLHSLNGITDSGTITVGAYLIVTTHDNNGSINLDQLAVDGPFHLNTHGTGNVTVVNDAHIVFASDRTIGGNLAVTARTGNISDHP
ncbi:uncharacterized protein METZ01_LOCUS405046, partial [marine metagenome]